jgi:hypothetical protein
MSFSAAAGNFQLFPSLGGGWKFSIISVPRWRLGKFNFFSLSAAAAENFLVLGGGG